MISIKGKNALITGASSGIGQACASAFAASGSNVILGARRIKKLQKIAQEISEKYGVETFAAYMDVRDYKSLEKTIATLPEQFQVINFLLNCAGLALGMNTVYDANIEDFNTMVDTNEKGVYNMTRLVLPQMLVRDEGYIFNIGSIAGQEVYTKGNVYCASKAAVRAFTKATGMDIQPHNVRVTLIEPGLTKTEFFKVRLKGNTQKAEHAYAGKQTLSPQDIAEIILFCATRDAHINIRQILVTPTHQASVGAAFKK